MQAARAVAIVGRRMASTDVIRSAGPIGKALSDVPSTKAEFVEKYTHTSQPSYLMGGNDSRIIPIAYVAVALATGFAAKGAYNAISGKGKKI